MRCPLNRSAALTSAPTRMVVPEDVMQRAYMMVARCGGDIEESGGRGLRGVRGLRGFGGTNDAGGGAARLCRDHLSRIVKPLRN